MTSSEDGSIKIWDGVSSRVMATFANAHDGAPVCSVQFSRNGKYVLSSGLDSLCKLWELSTTRCLIAYTGAGATGKQVTFFCIKNILKSLRSSFFHGFYIT